MWITGNPLWTTVVLQLDVPFIIMMYHKAHIFFFFVGTIQKKVTLIEIDLTKHTIYVYACGLTCTTVSRSSDKMLRFDSCSLVAKSRSIFTTHSAQ